MKNNLDSIIMDTNFVGIILEMTEDYEPITLTSQKPYTPEFPLYDNSLLVIDPTLNLYIFNPPNYLEIKNKELNNIKKCIKRIHPRPINLTKGEHPTEVFTNMLLLGITPEEAYEYITPTSLPFSKELFKILYIQASRHTITNESIIGGSVHIKSKDEYYFNPLGLDLREYIVSQIFDTISDLLNGHISSLSNKILIEGSHIIYPLFRMEDNQLIVEINKYPIIKPSKIDKQKIIITSPINNLFSSRDYTFRNLTVFAIAGLSLYFITIKNNVLFQGVFNLETNKGIKLITQEGTTHEEKIKHVTLTEKSLTVDDLEFTKLKIISTPQYALYLEKYYKKLIPEEELENIKKKKQKYIVSCKYYGQVVINYNPLFGVMLL